jgi:hypothetical protein
MLMSNIFSIKNNKLPDNKFEANLQRFLNWGNEDIKKIQKSFGILKGSIKKNPVSLQKEIRKELDR